MSRWSDRGYVEPLAAIAAVFAVSVGLSVYVVGLEGVVEGGDRSIAETVLEEIRDDAGGRAVLEPDRLSATSAPSGWEANVTLITRHGRVTAGPVPPNDAERASERVSVRLGPGTVRPGRLTVEVWQ